MTGGKNMEWQGPEPQEAAQGHRGHTHLAGWVALPILGVVQFRFLAVGKQPGPPYVAVT